MKSVFSPGTSAFSRLFRLSPLLPAILFMLIHYGCQPLASQRTAVAPPSGAELFRSKCGKCHDPELALKEYHSAKVWEDTINRMKVEHRADIRQEEIELLVKYHVERQQEEAALFREKCQKCHPGKVSLGKKLSAEQARATIKRMQQKAGNAIEDKDIEILVRYHVQSQQTAMGESLSGAFDASLSGMPGMKRGMALFMKKCSSCHKPDKAWAVIKDPEVWDKTVKRMQSYSKGEISDQEARELVDFHVTEQQREIETFKETCTKCHDDKRINSRSLSEEQWIALIKRMQQKAPELIPDEKVALLAAYFHRRELALARIFQGKCRLCHPDNPGGAPHPSSTYQMDGLIVLANEEFGRSLQVMDVNNLLSVHLQRQKREMQLYESTNACTTCHPRGLPVPEKRERTRAEWVAFIAELQEVELNKEIQNTIDSQIDYHISMH